MYFIFGRFQYFSPPNGDFPRAKIKIASQFCFSNVYRCFVARFFKFNFVFVSTLNGVFSKNSITQQMEISNACLQIFFSHLFFIDTQALDMQVFLFFFFEISSTSNLHKLRIFNFKVGPNLIFLPCLPSACDQARFHFGNHYQKNQTDFCH